MGGRLAVKGGCSEGEYVVAVGGLRLFVVGGSGSLTKWDAEAVVWGVTELSGGLWGRTP